jgi:hypothetical protein
MPGEDKHKQALKLLEEGRPRDAVHSLEQVLSEQPTAERWNDWGWLRRPAVARIKRRSVFGARLR